MNWWVIPGAIAVAVVWIMIDQNKARELQDKAREMICPHCQSKGTVTTKIVQLKRGVSGAKATGALLTGGISLLATGLSRKQEATEASCSHCGAVWHYE